MQYHQDLFTQALVPEISVAEQHDMKMFEYIVTETNNRHAGDNFTKARLEMTDNEADIHKAGEPDEKTKVNVTNKEMDVIISSANYKKSGTADKTETNVAKIAGLDVSSKTTDREKSENDADMAENEPVVARCKVDHHDSENVIDISENDPNVSRSKTTTKVLSTTLIWQTTS